MAPIKTNLAVLEKYEAFYTGGRIQISSDGNFMFCCVGQKVKVVDVATGKTRSVIGQEHEEISAFCLSPDDQSLVVATQNLLLRKWNWKEETLVKSWKAIHLTPVICMEFDPTSTLLATGGSDSLIKLWDSVGQYCTHNLRGHTGVVRLVRFHPDIARLQLVSSGDDYTVRVWNLKTSVCTAVIRDHYSLVKDLCFTNNGDTMYSCGGDKVVCVWDMTKPAVVKTLPIFESCEGVMIVESLTMVDISERSNHFVTVGSAGTLRVVNASSGNCVHTDRTLCEDRGGEEEGGEPIIVQAFFCPALDKLVVVTYDHNILFLSPDFSLHRQFSGNLEEVLDIGVLGKDGSHLVVISNSSKVKVFHRLTMQCQILSGHTDTVMAVNTLPKKNIFATASKDNRVRVWHLDPETSSVSCVALGEGHAKAVNTLAFTRLSAKQLISGGEDQTLKLWKIPPEVMSASDAAGEQLVSLHCTATHWAHEDDINYVTVAPNDQFLASASKDKTAKLWSLPDLTLKGVVRGHKRGVWCVQFSPTDRCFATSSADGTINVWNLADFSCLQTFEGHDSSVLKVLYISNGRQLLSSDSEGLVKLWTLKTNTCEKTLQAHDSKAWALTAHPSEELVFSGGADSTLITWKDTTEEEIQEARSKEEKMILQEQKLSNYIEEKKYLKAIGLAITLDQPFRVLKIIKAILKNPEGFQDLKATLCKLKPNQIGSLLRYSSEWNTNSRHCHSSQAVLNIILQSFTSEELLALPGFVSSLEALLPYTDRHFQRLNRLQQQATFADYTRKHMKTA